MNPSLVFASATSRLHVDLILARLKKAGMKLDGITAIHPKLHCPNTVSIWLDQSAEINITGGSTATAAGALRFEFFGTSGRHPATLREGLEKCGLSFEQSANLESTLLEERTLLCIEADDDTELSIIFHVLLHVGADKIAAVAREVPRRMERDAVGTKRSLPNVDQEVVAA